MILLLLLYILARQYLFFTQISMLIHEYIQFDQINKYMLSKLAQLKDPSQQSQYLVKLIEVSIKNSRQFINELNEQLIIQLKEVATKQNFSLWLELIITLLSIQQCFQYADANSKGTSPLLGLLDCVGQFKLEDKHQVVNKITMKYSTIEISVAIHAFIVRHCVNEVEQKLFPRLIPIFVKLSSLIIQKYLQLKNEPAKGTQDRIEDDKVILQSCQKWMSTNISLFFNKLGPVHDRLIKQLVLMAIGDVVGALLQIDRSNVLDKDLINNLLKNSLLAYCTANYTWNEVHHIFDSHIKIKKYNNPIKKIEIPEIYSDYSIRNVGLNTQAYTYIITKYVASGPACISSDQSILKLLVPAVSEILSRPFQIKILTMDWLQKVVTRLSDKQRITIRTGMEYGYPIQLFLFNIWHYERQRAQRLTPLFQFENETAHVNSLVKLQQLHIDNLSKQKDKFILKSIQNNKLYSQKVFLILNKFDFKSQKPNTQINALHLATQLKQKYNRKAVELGRKWEKESAQPIDNEVKLKLSQLCA